MLLFVSPAIYTETGKIDGYLLVKDGRIVEVGAGPVPAVLAGVPRVDVPDGRILPGMIDLHIHGAGGWGVEGVDGAGIRSLGRYLAAFGTTGFLATASARPLETLAGTVLAVREAIAAGVPDGAAILGTHLEGPYLNPTMKGAMNPDYFRAPSIPETERLLELSGQTVRRVTLAPEKPGAHALVRYLVGQGVVVAGGHTDATYDETLAGIEAGVRIGNHTYNAMKGLHHREPGALGAYLTDDRILCEAICDFMHVHPGALKLLWRAVGRDRLALISDAIPAAGMPPGDYAFLGRDVHLDAQGFSKLANGTIAGSTKTMLHGLRNLIEGLGLSWEDAAHVAALTPARAIGLGERKGSLAPGKDADLFVLGPDWQVSWTVVEGHVVRRPGDAAPQLNPEFLAARKGD